MSGVCASPDRSAAPLANRPPRFFSAKQPGRFQHTWGSATIGLILAAAGPAVAGDSEPPAHGFHSRNFTVVSTFLAWRTDTLRGESPRMVIRRVLGLTLRNTTGGLRTLSVRLVPSAGQLPCEDVLHIEPDAGSEFACAQDTVLADTDYRLAVTVCADDALTDTLESCTLRLSFEPAVVRANDSAIVMAERELAAMELPRTYDNLELRRGVLHRVRGRLTVREDGIEFVAKGETFSLPVSGMRNTSLDAGRVRLDYEDGGRHRTLHFAIASFWEKLETEGLPRGSPQLDDVEKSLAAAIARAHPESALPAAGGGIRGLLTRMFEGPPPAPPPPVPVYSYTRREGLFGGGGLGLNLVRDSLTTVDVKSHAGLGFTFSGGIYLNPRVALGARLVGMTAGIDPAAGFAGADLQYWVDDGFFLGASYGVLGSYSPSSSGIAARIGGGVPVSRDATGLGTLEVLFDVNGRFIGAAIQAEAQFVWQPLAKRGR
jgi:hypothetical protein